jgi:hypothetical protein
MLLKTVKYSKITELFHLITVLYAFLSYTEKRLFHMLSITGFIYLKEVGNIKRKLCDQPQCIHINGGYK